MNSEAFCGLASRLLRHPTAPYHEHAVRQEVELICREHGLPFELDQFGNALVRLRNANQPPLVLAAHMDHPGFEVLGPSRRGHRWPARFCGGVADSYFRPGIPLRLMPGAIPARLGVRESPTERLFEIQSARRLTQSPRFAVWELEDFAVRRGRIYARACDDLIGVAAGLGTLIALKQSRAPVHVVGALTRAEEVGFRGALALAAAGDLARSGLVISLETSRELPGVKMGCGVIIRVGDKASIFDSAATRFLSEVGVDLKARCERFCFQRALMSGGTCEATAYQELGFRSAAVCVALGNYHNCGPANRIQAEYVSLSDACGMVDLLAAAARNLSRYELLVGKLPARLRKLLSEAVPKLKRTAAESR